jgi:hypothetical protein
MILQLELLDAGAILAILEAKKAKSKLATHNMNKIEKYAETFVDVELSEIKRRKYKKDLLQVLQKLPLMNGKNKHEFLKEDNFGFDQQKVPNETTAAKILKYNSYSTSKSKSSKLLYSSEVLIDTLLI